MASNWPNKNTPGHSIKDMYGRLVNKVSEPPKEEASVEAGPPTTNGINGITVKQE